MSFSAPDDYLLGARPQVLKRKHERSHSESQRPRMNKKPSFLFFNKGTKVRCAVAAHDEGCSLCYSHRVQRSCSRCTQKSTAVLEIDKALKRADRDASKYVPERHTARFLCHGVGVKCLRVGRLRLGMVRVSRARPVERDLLCVTQDTDEGAAWT